MKLLPKFLEPSPLDSDRSAFVVNIIEPAWLTARTFCFILILLATVVGSSCHSAPSVTNSLAGTYICDGVLSITIRLVVKPDGTYEASAEQPAGVRHESGVWKVSGEDLLMQRRGGDIGHPIRRLRPDQEISGRLLWIVPGAGGTGGAVTYPFFHREVSPTNKPQVGFRFGNGGILGA